MGDQMMKTAQPTTMKTDFKTTRADVVFNRGLCKCNLSTKEDSLTVPMAKVSYLRDALSDFRQAKELSQTTSFTEVCAKKIAAGMEAFIN